MLLGHASSSLVLAPAGEPAQRASVERCAVAADSRQRELRESLRRERGAERGVPVGCAAVAEATTPGRVPSRLRRSQLYTERRQGPERNSRWGGSVD
jgi:hypothetical protein